MKKSSRHCDRQRNLDSRASSKDSTRAVLKVIHLNRQKKPQVKSARKWNSNEKQFKNELEQRTREWKQRMNELVDSLEQQ